MGRRWWGALGVSVAVAFAVAGPLAAPVSAVEGGIELDAAIDGQAVKGAGANDPIELGGSRQAVVRADITNHTGEDLVVRRIRLDATALGLTFIAYDTVVPTRVPPGATRRVEFELPVDDVAHQAVGLLPGSIGIYDAAGTRVAGQPFTMDVKGRTWSIFGTFAILIAAFTVATFAVNLWLVARRRLPAHRFMRGLRFAVTGAGLGLTICFTLAAFRIVPPYPGVWPTLVAIPTLAAFVLGVVSPGPLAIEEDEIDKALREYRSSLASA